MASEEKVHRDLKLARLENDFIRACGAVKSRGIQVRDIKNRFLEEFLEIERDKSSRLSDEVSIARKEIEGLKVSSPILLLALYKTPLAYCVALTQKAEVMFMVGFIWNSLPGKRIRGR